VANEKSVPEAVRIFLAAHQRYLQAEGDLSRRFEETIQQLSARARITLQFTA